MRNILMVFLLKDTTLGDLRLPKPINPLLSRGRRCRTPVLNFFDHEPCRDACTMIIVHACTMVRVHLRCPTAHTALMFGAMQVEGSRGRSALVMQGDFEGRRAPRCLTFSITPTPFPPPPPPYKKVTYGGPQKTMSICLASWLRRGA